MPRVIIEAHARRRMQKRDISDEKVAHVWLQHDDERPSPQHPGFLVRKGRTRAGRRVTVVARVDAEEFRGKAVW